MEKVVRGVRQLKFPGMGGRNTFLANVSKLLTGNVVSQAILLFLTPVITRLYDPGDYGIMILVGSIVSISSIFTCMQYETAIIIEKDKEKAIHIAYMCFILCIAVTIILSLIYSLLTILGNNIFPEHSTYLALLALLCVLAIGFEKPIKNILVRNKYYEVLAKLIVYSTLLTVSIKLIYGCIYGSNAYVLVAANLSGIVFAVMMMSLVLHRDRFFSGLSQFNFSDAIIVAQKHKEFPRYQVINNLLNALSQNAVILLLSIFFTPQAVGFYGLGRSVLQKPIRLIGGSFGHAYLQNVSEFQDDHTALKTSMLKSTIVFGVIGLCPFGILMFFGSDIFAFAFGERWREAGLYAQFMSPWLFMVFINNPARQIVVLLKKLKFDFLYNLGVFAFRFIAVFSMAYIYKSVEVVVLVFSIVGTLSNIYYISYAYECTKLLSNEKNIV